MLHKKILEKSRLNRRKRRSKLKSKTEAKVVSYMAGAFGLSKKPEIDIDNNNSKSKVDFVGTVSIVFVDDKDVTFIR